MKIAVYANITLGGAHGGVEHFTMSLIRALGRLEDGDEEYVIIAHQDYQDWFRQNLGRNQEITTEPPSAKPDTVGSIKQGIPGFLVPTLRFARNLLLRAVGTSYYNRPPRSTGFLESLGVDVVHFPFPHYIPSTLPTIYCPHDLQHLHYPEYFSRESLEYRRHAYPAHCHWSQAVAVDLRWIKEDIIRHYHIIPEKIYVIPFAAPTEMYEPVSKELLRQVTQKFNLPPTFAFYPAQTWAHKNHIRLLEAMALLREQQNLVVNLVCTGHKNEFWPKIVERINELKLENQVRFLGYVEPEELRALYQLAQFFVFPTLFEGGGLPVYEAFQEGTAVACSDISALRGLTGDAALLFNPDSLDDIARALQQMTTDVKLREELSKRGKKRSQRFTWERTARSYRALYRKMAGRTLSAEDDLLLQGPENV